MARLATTKREDLGRAHLKAMRRATEALNSAVVSISLDEGRSVNAD
jgi:hypothetical protein